MAFAANFKLNSEVGYFDVAAELKPLLHLWSLAIEEQFYLVWPLLLWICFRQKLNLFTVTLALGLLSYQSRKHFGTTASESFYFPWTRFWELQAGALLALWNAEYAPRFFELWNRFEKYIRPLILSADASRDGHTTTPFFKSTLSLLGVALVVWSCVSFTKATPFPSRFTIYPVLGSVLIIAAGKDAWFNKWVLSLRPMKFIGNISFPLYLWHWPILSFARIILGEPSFKVAAVAVALSFVLSVLTYFLVEQKLRFNTSRRAWKAPALAAGLCGMILIVKFIPIVTRSAEYGVERINSAIGVWEYPTKNMTLKTFPNGIKYHELSVNSSERVLFMGSSHMCQWAPAIDKLVQEKKIFSNVLFLELSGCSGSAEPNGYKMVEEFIRNEVKFQKIVWAAYWRNQYWDDFYQQSIRSILQTARAHNQKITFLLDYASGDEFDPALMIKRSIFGGFQIGPATISKTEILQRDFKVREAIKETAAAFGAETFDPAEYLCSENSCPIRDRDGYPLYKDGNHFTPTASEKHLGFIKELFDETIVETPGIQSGTARRTEKNRKSQ